jgi:hypothetical protein
MVGNAVTLGEREARRASNVLVARSEETIPPVGVLKDVLNMYGVVV